MKLTNLSLLVLATLSMGTLALRAEDTTSPTEHKGEGFRKMLLEKFDTNHDGKLDETERTAAKSALKDRMKEKAYAKYDTDGDGTLSDSEKAAAKAAFKAHREQMLSKFDANNDGKLEPNERKTAYEAKREWKKENHTGKKTK